MFVTLACFDYFKLTNKNLNVFISYVTDSAVLVQVLLPCYNI